jgi:nitrate reductase delta subunit
MVHRVALESWADILTYPGEEAGTRVLDRISAIKLAAPAAGERLSALEEFSTSRESAELEELFTRTFDSNAERALELGWHLHGENYARGAFMVRMRQMMRELSIPESCELPDHVSHLLTILARGDEDTFRAITRGVVLPALEKIEEGFKDEANPYHGVLAGLHSFLEESLAELDEQPAEETDD